MDRASEHAIAFRSDRLSHCWRSYSLRRPSSQNASDLAKEMIGEWELSTAGRDRTCASR